MCSGRRHAETPGEPVPPIDISKIKGEEVELLVTGYCNCGQCCGWRKQWYFFGEPVYNYGKMEGQPKKVGVTASGSVARHGTVAADPSIYPFGTELAIPGYGMAVVQDIGGAIKGEHIDIWFPSHEEARAWGVQKLKVKLVSRPKPKPQTKH